MVARTVTIKPDGSIVGAGPTPLRGLHEKVRINGRVATIGTPQIVPLQPVPSQILDITLGQQACTIKIYFKRIQVPLAAAIPTDPPVFGYAMPCFIDLYVDGTLRMGGVICQHKNAIVREPYLKFSGELYFVDMQGDSDPEIVGLGTRWLLAYFPG